LADVFVDKVEVSYKFVAGAPVFVFSAVSAYLRVLCVEVAVNAENTEGRRDRREVYLSPAGPYYEHSLLLLLSADPAAAFKCAVTNFIKQRV
jgi:hypothetical protein